MAKYEALRDTRISHENREVTAGEIFETEFPMIAGKPMTIGSNLRLIEEEVEEPAPVVKKRGRPFASDSGDE